MKTILFTILRVIALAIIFTLLLTVSSALTTPQELAERLTPAQASQSMAALPAASLIMTVMLAYLALRSRWHGWKLAGSLFLIFFSLYAFLGWIELLAFPVVASKMPAGALTSLLLVGLIVGLPFSLLAVWVLGKTRPDPADASLPPRFQMPAGEWAWKLVAGALLYVVIYFAFGYYVAWRTPGLPEFYGGSPTTFVGQLANNWRLIPWLYPLQILRGLIWVGLGCLILAMHKGKTWEVILATGLTFTVVMNASLLFPNTWMPPAVAHAHTVELITSNLLYGLLLAALLLWHPSWRVRTVEAPHPAH